MTGRRAFVPELTVCFCIALLVALAAAPAARSQEDRTEFQERFNRGVSAAKSAKEKVDSARDLKEQTWDRLPEEGQDLAKEATKEGAGKGWEKVKQSKTLGKAAKQAEKVVKPLAKKAAKFVAKKGIPVVNYYTTGQDIGTFIEKRLPEEASLWIGERVAKNIVYPLTGDRDAEPSPLPADVPAGGPDALDRDIARLLEEKKRLDEQYRQWDAGGGDGSPSWGREDNTWEESAEPSYGEETDWEQEAGSGNWPATDTGWDDDEWGREPDEGTHWGEESHYAASSSGEGSAVPSHDEEAGWEQQAGSRTWSASDAGTGWDGGEWDQASDGGTGWDDESTYAAGSIQDYDDLMAELLQEEDEKRSEEEEARRILAIDAEHRRREAERLGLEQEQQQAEDGEAGQLRQEARLLSEERERLEQEKESLRQEREYQERLAAERQSARTAEEQARQAREARQENRKAWANLANTIVTGVARIKAVRSGIDPSSIPGPSMSISPEAWGAVQRGAKIFEQTMGTKVPVPSCPPGMMKPCRVTDPCVPIAQVKAVC